MQSTGWLCHDTCNHVSVAQLVPGEAAISAGSDQEPEFGSFRQQTEPVHYPGGVHIQPDNITNFLSEVGIIAYLERSEPVRLQICCFPDLMHLPACHPGMLRHETDAPMCGLFWYFMGRVI